MIRNLINNKPIKLFVFLSGIFIANTLIAEIIGVKLFQLESTVGIQNFNFKLLGEENLSLVLSAGVVTWPLVFIMTDIINEYYGVKGVRFLSFFTAGLIVFAFVIFYFAIRLSPADWWLNSQAQNQKIPVPNMQNAYAQILGQGMNIIFASIVAFIVGQFLDAYVFKFLKIKYSGKQIWLRATLSTLVSQLIDTIVVSYIYLYFSLGNSFARVTAIAIVSYGYKLTIAILFTPIIYLVKYLIEKYLGKQQAEEMKQSAVNY